MKKMLTALTLALLAGSAFAATTPAASSTTPTQSTKPAAKPAAHKAKAAAPKCKEGEAVVKGKCEKKPA
jgi:hypothetical protein